MTGRWPVTLLAVAGSLTAGFAAQAAGSGVASLAWALAAGLGLSLMVHGPWLRLLGVALTVLAVASGGWAAQAAQWVALGGFAVAAVALAAVCAAIAGQAHAQQARQPLPLEPRGTTGEAIFPAFEGWGPHKDGSIVLLLGYYNRNKGNAIDIPVGPNNRIEPGGPDMGQPTHFAPGRQWGVFTIKLPKDFGAKKLTWTIVANGLTNAITLHTQADYVVEPFEDAANKNTPPKLKFRDGDGPFMALHAETTDKLMIFGENGRFYTLPANNLPGGRGLGEFVQEQHKPVVAQVAGMLTEDAQSLVQRHIGFFFLSGDARIGGKKVLHQLPDQTRTSFIAGRSRESSLQGVNGPAFLHRPPAGIVRRLVKCLQEALVAQALTAADELVVATCDLDWCRRYTSTVFDFARYRRPEVYGAITEPLP